MWDSCQTGFDVIKEPLIIASIIVGFLSIFEHSKWLCKERIGTVLNAWINIFILCGILKLLWIAVGRGMNDVIQNWRDGNGNNMLLKPVYNIHQQLPQNPNPQIPPNEPNPPVPPQRNPQVPPQPNPQVPPQPNPQVPPQPNPPAPAQPNPPVPAQPNPPVPPQPNPPVPAQPNPQVPPQPDPQVPPQPNPQVPPPVPIPLQCFFCGFPHARSCAARQRENANVWGMRVPHDNLQG
ncbi:unnamed protein product [Orchesella dallaii]|uniref:Filamentous hemagglutinin n=1 Tax=Orchesella dallaii TaxID=48710 RepID=A0ABP1Q7P1_9HEXA